MRLRHRDFFIEDSEHRGQTLRDVYLQPLQAQLDARNRHDETSPEQEGGVPVGLFEEARQPFTLVLSIQMLMRGWPVLVEQLQRMNESGYLSSRSAGGNVERPVAVVVSEEMSLAV